MHQVEGRMGVQTLALPLYTHLTPDTPPPPRSHTLSSQVLAAVDLSTNTCWRQLNLWTSRQKNRLTEEREGIRGGGVRGGGQDRGSGRGKDALEETVQWSPCYLISFCASAENLYTFIVF